MSNRKSNRPAQRNTSGTKKTQSARSKGLGDSVEKILQKTGIKTAVQFIMGEDCGCEERKQKLNELFPYKQPLCMTENEHQWWTQFIATNSTTISNEETKMIVAIYNRIFQTRRTYKPCKCNPKAWQKMIDEINIIFNTYDQNQTENTMA